MKKIITSIILLTNLIGNAQCPVPSNLSYISINPQDVQLNWTENGNANNWDITVVPNFYVGTPLPTDSYYVSSTNPFIFVNFPPTGCNVFFIRSRCSSTEVSQWVALATSECDTNVYSYLATLSNNDFLIINNEVKIYPNPTKNIIQIENKSEIEKIKIFNYLGKEVLTQTRNNNEINVENLSKGIYLIEIYSENQKVYKKFIKE